MNVFNPGFVFFAISLALLGGAIAVHVSSVNLSLPISSLTLTTILIPLIAIPNALYRSRLLHAALTSHARVEHILPNALQTLQAVPTTAIATLLLQYFLPGSTVLDCALGSRWQHFFAAKDGPAIRHLQDALDCCGFNSVRDRAWPFPEGSTGSPLRCVQRFERDTACAEPWRDATRRNAGIDFGIILAVALMQIATILIARPAGSWRDSWWARGWARPAPEPRNLIEERERVRPLLEGPESQEDSDEPVRYRDLSPTMVMPPHQGYGTNAPHDPDASGPRVEPSALARNVWDGE